MIKYFNAEDVEAEHDDQAVANYAAMAVWPQTSLSVVNIGQERIIAFGLLAVTMMAGADVEKGNLTVECFVAVNTYLLQLYLPLNVLGWVYLELRQALVDRERMFGPLAFDNVSFAYGEWPILKDISFRISAGKSVASDGLSGLAK